MQQASYALHRAAGRERIEAAIAAGYSAKSRRSLSVTAHRLENDPRVIRRIAAYRRGAMGEELVASETSEAEEDTRRFAFYSNGRGPDRDDAVDRAVLERFDDDLANPARPWGPQPGPQRMFAECPADISVYGGAANSGKSIAALYEKAKWSHVPGFRSVIFRRRTPDLTGPQGLWDESQTMFRDFGGQPRAGKYLDWRWPSGARSVFRHMQLERDKENHRGLRYALIIFDELTHFTESQFWFLFSRLGSTCGVNPYMRATCNPDRNSWVRKLIDWWIGPDGYPIPERSGVLRWFIRDGDAMHWYDSEDDAVEAWPKRRPKSFTFIAAKTADNAIALAQDPEAIERLQNLPHVLRMQLLGEGDGSRGGNWDATESAGLVFKRENFRIQSKPPSPVIRTLRCWDKGATKPHKGNPDPDWTRGVRVSLCAGGEWWVDDMVSLRDGPAEVFAFMRRTAEGFRRDGELVLGPDGRPIEPGDGVEVEVAIWQDQGQAGKVDADATIAVLAGFAVHVVRAAESSRPGSGGRAKIAHANVWAPLQQKGGVYVKLAPWAEELISEHDGFPTARHDDAVDCLSLAAQVFASGASISMAEALERMRQW